MEYTHERGLLQNLTSDEGSNGEELHGWDEVVRIDAQMIRGMVCAHQKSSSTSASTPEPKADRPALGGL